VSEDTRLDRSILRDRLLEFHASYVRCIDTDNLEDWPGHFTAECHYRVTNADNERDNLPAGLMFATSRAMLEDRVSALRHANIYERQRYRHILGQVSILSRGPQQAECETPFMVARIVQSDDTTLFATGVYRDIFELGAERVLLKQRVVVCDSSRIDTLLAIPL
jgi:3-phenylpropionate/cinnamic acid dioxygenase small subunit